MVRMSGRQPKVSEPHQAPVRPKPQMTSSTMRRTSYSRQMRWISGQ